MPSPLSRRMNEAESFELKMNEAMSLDGDVDQDRSEKTGPRS